MTALGFGGSLDGLSGVGAATGAATGLLVRQVSLMRQDTLNKFVAEMLADPRTLKFASAPPTQSNMQKLAEAGMKAGYFRALGQNQEPTNEMDSAFQAAPRNVSELSDEELEAIINGTEPLAPETPVAKQDVSALINSKPPIVKAIAWQESRFNPKAVSKVGAQGLMQLMPKTAESLGVKDPFNATENLEAGERYYNKLLKQFKKPELALAAYNWGEGNVNKALKRLRKSELALTWDNVLQHSVVPKETKLYVKSVLSKAKEFEV
jgi:soluble lytic murein transglycosylase-like protein